MDDRCRGLGTDLGLLCLRSKACALLPGFVVVVFLIDSLLGWHHLGGRGRQISEIKASLIYKSFRTVRAVIQRNLVSKKTKEKDLLLESQEPLTPMEAE